MILEMNMADKQVFIDIAKYQLLFESGAIEIALPLGNSINSLAG